MVKFSCSFDSKGFAKNLVLLGAVCGGLAYYVYLCGWCAGHKSTNRYAKACVKDVLADEESHLTDRSKNLLEQAEELL